MLTFCAASMAFWNTFDAIWLASLRVKCRQDSELTGVATGAGIVANIMLAVYFIKLVNQ